MVTPFFTCPIFVVSKAKGRNKKYTDLWGVQGEGLLKWIMVARPLFSFNFDSTIQVDLFDRIEKDPREPGNFQTYLYLMALAASYGSEVTLVFEGEDVRKAQEVILNLFQTKFGETK